MPSQNVVTANIRGIAAHSGVEPEKGLSAILIAAEILTQLPLGRIDAETTANVGRIDGGLKRNIIPEETFMDGEIRSRDNAKLDHYSDEFRRIFKEAAIRHPDARIDLDIRNTYQAFRVDASHPAVTMSVPEIESPIYANSRALAGDINHGVHIMSIVVIARTGG